MKDQLNKENKKSLSITIIAIVVVICLLTAGAVGILISTGKNSEKVSPSNQEAAKQEPAFTPLVITGSGTKVTEPFTLEPGGYKVSSEYNAEGQYADSSNFIVHILNGEGQEGPLVANLLGSGTTSDAVQIKGGKYFFKVTSQGSWKLTVDKL